jgi:hypothetical protein
MIQTDFTLRGFTELFNDLAGPGHPHHRFQRCVLGGEDDIGLQRLGVAHALPHQPPAAPGGVHRIRQGEPPLVIPAWALRPLLQGEVF